MKARHRTDIEADLWPETGDLFLAQGKIEIIKMYIPPLSDTDNWSCLMTLGCKTKQMIMQLIIVICNIKQLLSRNHQ